MLEELQLRNYADSRLNTIWTRSGVSRSSFPLSSRNSLSRCGTHPALRSCRFRWLRFHFHRCPPLPLSGCNSPTGSQPHVAPTCLAGRCAWRTASGTEPSPDVCYLLFNIPPHLLKANQCGFEQGCVGCSSASGHVQVFSWFATILHIRVTEPIVARLGHS
jgi:hypothetical protein